MDSYASEDPWLEEAPAFPVNSPEHGFLADLDEVRFEIIDKSGHPLWVLPSVKHFNARSGFVIGLERPLTRLVWTKPPTKSGNSETEHYASMSAIFLSLYGKGGLTVGAES